MKTIEMLYVFTIVHLISMCISLMMLFNKISFYNRVKVVIL
jgi:hypothetical protein